MKLKFNAETLGLLLTVVISIPNSALAQLAPAPYSIKGPCPTQGTWTAAALTQTTQIKQAITAFKDNPACKSLKSTMETNLTMMENALNEVNKVDGLTDQRTRTLSELPQEMSALRSFYRTSGGFKPVVMDMLFGKTVQMNALSTANTNGPVTPIDPTKASLQNLAGRSKAATLTGLRLFNTTMSAFEDAQANCLESGQTGAVIASGLVKVLNSFASANNGVNDQVALAVAKITSYLGKDKKYIDALRDLNDAEFVTSMSCLLEVTTEGFCNALDAQYLLKETTANGSLTIKEVTNKKTGKKTQKLLGINRNFDQRLATGALAGYYILTRQVPVVTEWLQKVQYGITPQLPTESTFQVSVSTNVQGHYNLIKNIQGTFNQNRTTMKAISDYKTKQGIALQILMDVGSQMVGFPNTPGLNFFTQARNANEIYFGLMGMQIPDAVMGKGEGGQTYGSHPAEWITAFFRDQPAFQDPDKLVDLIDQNMQVIFREATNAAINYYNQYFIVDKPQVVADSLLGMDSNVRDALVNIDVYLENFAKRYSSQPEQLQDPSLLPIVKETKGKIAQVLLRYKELRNYGRKIYNLDKNSPESADLSPKAISEALGHISDDLLKEVYTQFQVLTARTGMLSNRMSAIVLQDYLMTLKNRDQFENQFEDIMLSTGVTALNQMINMSNNDLSDLQIDLARAGKIYKEDIDALEKITAPVFVRHIFNNRIALNNQNITVEQRNILAYNWSLKMAQEQYPGEDSNFIQRKARAIFSRIWGDFTNRDEAYFGVSQKDKAAHPFLQLARPFGYRSPIISSPASTFDNNGKMLAYLCTQSLAFADFSPYYALCKNTRLDSPLLNDDVVVNDPQVKLLLENYLSIPYAKKAVEALDAPKPKQTLGQRALQIGQNILNRYKALIAPETEEILPKNQNLDNAKNKEARICAYRDFRRRNKIAYVTAAMRNDSDTYESSFMKSLGPEVQVSNIVLEPPTK